MFDPSLAAELLATYPVDDPLRWPDAMQAERGRFVDAVVSNLSALDLSDPPVAFEIAQTALTGSNPAFSERFPALIMAGPLVDLIDPAALLSLVAPFLTPTAIVAGLIPCLRDNSPESAAFAEACAAAQWNCPTAEELLESLIECGLEVQPGWRFIPSPVFRSESGLRKVCFGPHLRAIKAVESAGYDPGEIGWGELRFSGCLNQSPSNS